MNSQPVCGGDELRARWACQRLAGLGITAEPVNDPDAGGHTGKVAIDPDQLLDVLATDFIAVEEWE